MKSNLRRSFAAAMLAALAACAGSDLLGPERTESRIVHGHIVVTLDVTPEALRSPGTFVATLTYENRGQETVTLTSGYGCLSFASVFLGEEQIPFPATQYACTTAVSYHDLLPGDPIIVRWELTVGGEDGYPATPGTYRFVAHLNTHGTDLEHPFVIQ